MRKALWVLCTALSLGSLSQAYAYEHSYQLLKCMESDPARSCYLAEIEVFDGELNSLYKDILQHLKDNPAQHKKFKDSQIAWLKFATQNREFIQSLGSDAALEEGDLAYLKLLKARVEEFDLLLSVFFGEASYPNP